MNKSLTAVAVFLAAALLYALHLIGSMDRFHIASTDNLIYKLDRKTGDVWIIFGGQAKQIENAGGEEPTSDDGRAIALTKGSEAFGGGHKTDESIRKFLGGRQGLLTIRGWVAEKKEEKVYLVSYRFVDELGENGFYFEANLVADIVRPVLGDRELEKNYGLTELGDKNRNRAIRNMLSRNPVKEGI